MSKKVVASNAALPPPVSAYPVHESIEQVKQRDYTLKAGVLGMGPTKEKIVIDIPDDDDEKAAQPEIRNEPVVRRERSTLSSFTDRSEHIPLGLSRVKCQENLHLMHSITNKQNERTS